MEELTQGSAIDGTHVVFSGVLEKEITLLAAFVVRRNVGKRACPVREFRFTQVFVSTMTIEMNNVIWATSIFGVFEFF